MYIKLTERCNMKCGHCAMAATSKGRDMPFDIFKLAMDQAERYGETVALGGGEPTLHPLFWQLIGYALSKDLEGSLWLATNGKRTKDALRLAALARNGTLGVALSQDEWHGKIDPRVVQAFTQKNDVTYHGGYNNPYPNDYREIRTVKEPYKAGRWTSGARRCACPELVVDPDGAIRQCGCLDSPKLCHIRDGIRKEWIEPTEGCWKPEEPRQQEHAA